MLCHHLSEFRLNFEFTKLFLTFRVEVNKYLFQKGIELHWSTNFLWKFRIIIFVLFVDIVNFAESILWNLSFCYSKQSLETNIGHFGIILKENAYFFQSLWWYFALNFTINGESKGAFIQHEVHLSAKWHFLCFRPSTFIWIAISSPQTLWSTLFDVYIQTKLILFHNFKQMIKIIETKLMVNAYWSLMHADRSESIVVELIVLAHLD
jgi:hypothetical protein